MDLMIGTF